MFLVCIPYYCYALLGLHSFDLYDSRNIYHSLSTVCTGFPIDAEDEKGNTLLLVASQNSNRRLVEMLLVRGADINHQNAQGNTALHFALTFDSEGHLGEYLIEHGADDTIENIDGLTPYDGVTA